MKTSRRDFIKSTGYVAVGFSIFPGMVLAGTENELQDSLFQDDRISDWLQILEDGRVRIFTGKMELGQGIRIAIAQVAAEELNTNPDLIEVHLAETGVTPNEGYTAGSQSISTSAMSVRRAAAAAAGILIRKAAEKYKLSEDELYLENGKILSKNSDFSQSFYKVLDGEQIEEVVPETVKSRAKERKFVGTPVPRKDIGKMLRGETLYVQDLRFPEMLHARIVRPPAYEAKLISLNKEILGEVEFTEIISKNNFVGILAEDEFQAVKAKRLLEKHSEWEIQQHLETKDSLKDYIKNLPGKKENVENEGRLNFDKNTVEAEYFKPYIMHAAIGPSCAVAHFEDNQLHVWSHTQGVYPLREALADLLDVPEENVRITGVPGSGCYGHNGADDVAAEAAILAKEFPNRYIRLQWERSDEHAWEPYGSAMGMKLKASLTDAGKIDSWQYEVWTDTHSTRPGGNKDNLLPTRFYEGTEKKKLSGFLGGGYRNANPYYPISNKKINARFFEGPLRVSALRSLGAYANIFAIESFMDELAEKAEEDSVEFRLKHLDDERAKAVLLKVREMVGNTKPDANQGIGFAFSRYKNSASYFAVAALVENISDEIKVKKMWGAIDSGEVINPDGLRNQTQGGMIQSASWTVKEAVKFDENHISSTDWETYPIFRFPEIPDIEVEILDRPDEKPLGAGEAAQGPTAAAIANAVYKATGRRVYDLPINKTNT